MKLHFLFKHKNKDENERLICLPFSFHKFSVIKQFVSARFPPRWNRLELDNLFTIKPFLHGRMWKTSSSILCCCCCFFAKTNTWAELMRKNDKFVCQDSKTDDIGKIDVRISYVIDQSINCALWYSNYGCCYYWQWAIHSSSSCISNEFCMRAEVTNNSWRRNNNDRHKTKKKTKLKVNWESREWMIIRSFINCWVEIRRRKEETQRVYHF